MKRWNRHIGWLLGSMMVLLFQACYDYEADYKVSKMTPTLQIHVFTPEHPVVTRVDKGPVEAETLERTIHDLRIWVFEHNNGNLVGYLHPSNIPLETGTTYMMAVSDQFAQDHPNVDVYVMANVSAGNCGLSVPLNAETTRADLDGILIGHSETNDFFGLTTPQTEVPDDGLPMSGVLKDQALTVNAPILSVGNVPVVRAVSKVRFVFSRSTSTDQELKIKKITLDDGMIPKAEYLFLENAYEDRRCHVKNNQGDADYESGATLCDYGETPLLVPASDDPAKFAYNGAISGQEYENLINTELTKTETETVKREIIETQPYYLRETDRKVTGKIYYTIGDSEETSIDFSLDAAGDFARNHTWIVYGYFAGSNNLRIFTVIFTPWTTLDPETHSVYNW